MSNLLRRSALAIFKLRDSLTVADPNPMKTPTPRQCGEADKSANHIVMDCTQGMTTDARKRLPENDESPATREQIKVINVRPRALLTLMATTGVPKVWIIITNDDNGREIGYKLGEDI